MPVSSSWSRRDLAQLQEIVIRIVKAHDPTGLLGMGAPDDEYEGAIIRIISGLASRRHPPSPDETAELVHSIFVKQFNPDIAGPLEKYLSIGKEIVALWPPE
jgi:hypothetical protein